MLGSSDMAQSYVHISEYPANLRRFQTGQESAYRMYCHQGESNPVTWITSDEIKPIGPVFGNGFLRGNMMLDLGDHFTIAGIKATFLNYAVGSSTFDDYSPSLAPTAYATRLNWLRQRMAQMPSHRDPVLIIDQGMSGIGSVAYGTAMTELITALRTDLACSTMRIILVTPPKSGMGTVPAWIALEALEEEWAASDQYTTLAHNYDATFVNDTTLVEGQATGVHYDSASARILAIGPDSSRVRSIATGVRWAIGY